ncbi:MAG: response regulator [Deltaproteobacteria bacterium]|nr:response regulator [Deltaproteobacteria bacterium]
MKLDKKETPSLEEGSPRPDTETVKREREDLKARLRQAQRMEAIGRLAGGVAHNLNNILSPVIGYTDMALVSLDPSDPLYVQMKDIRAATERATDLVQQLLAFGRKQAFALRTKNLSNVVSDLESILRQTIREDIELKFILDDNLHSIKADLSQIQQIIVNLSLNACEAMPDGGVLTIKTENIDLNPPPDDVLDGAPAGPHIVLSVRDTGKGMDQELQSHVFEPFFTTKEIGEGTGLGLSTVYGIVRQHGGYIRVVSEPGLGAAFNVYLPRFEESSVSSSKSPIQSTTGVVKETIFVVEDEKSLLKFICLVLSKMGYDVLEAPNGHTALEIAEQHDGPIHLLLTDVIMPGINGRELYENLSKTHPEMKILYMSGYPDNVIARHGILSEGENLLSKPTTVDQLTEKVRKVLDG